MAGGCSSRGRRRGARRRGHGAARAGPAEAGAVSSDVARPWHRCRCSRAALVPVPRQRQATKIGPPFTSGDPRLERAYRVQMNTLEWGAMALPSMWIVALFLSPCWASVGGAVWIIARAWYAVSYMKDPQTRLKPFFLNVTTVAVMFLAGVWGVVRGLI